jgi:hypothetical protein
MCTTDEHVDQICMVKKSFLWSVVDDDWVTSCSALFLLSLFSHDKGCKLVGYYSSTYNSSTGVSTSVYAPMYSYLLYVYTGGVLNLARLT